MTSSFYKHAIETLESHFGRKFGTTETRVKVLNAVWSNVREYDDKDLELAGDRLIMNSRMLPTPAEFQAAIITQAEQRQRTMTDAIERESKDNNAQEWDWSQTAKNSDIAKAAADHAARFLGFCTPGCKCTYCKSKRADGLRNLEMLHVQFPLAGWHKVASTRRTRYEEQELI